MMAPPTIPYVVPDGDGSSLRDPWILSHDGEGVFSVEVWSVVPAK
jgi:hypothetical protein